jgi:hypothetical protein
MVRRQNPPAGIILPLAPTRCRTVGDAVLECGKMDSDAPESTKKLKLFFVSWRKIKFFAGRQDMAVSDAGAIAGGGGEGQQG